MKTLAPILIFAIPILLFVRVAYLILFVSSPDAAFLDHVYRQAAYTIVWAIQLSYVAWLSVKWMAQNRAAQRAGILDSLHESSSN